MGNLGFNEHPRPPQGYRTLRVGEIRPDDLVWDWLGKEWLRADDPEWGSHCFAAEECVGVARALNTYSTKSRS